jgi:O-succinylbenzoic acid--CoA ligase
LPEGTAVAALTSGSTGRPGLVALSAEAVKASARLSAERLGGQGHWLLALPLDHIAGINVAARALLAGGALGAMPPGPFTWQACAAAAAALPPGPRYVSLVPTQLRRLVLGGRDAIAALAGFEAVLVGGAGLDAELRSGAAAGGAPLVETYGMAETCGGCVYDGQPLDSVSAQISPDGRIELAGPTLALGYAEGGRGGFFERAGQRWFRSSDLGRWGDDGALEVIGRTDNAITTGGLTLAAEPIEAALRELPGVVDAIVLGLDDPEWGQTLTALIEVEALAQAGGQGPALAELRGWVKDKLGPAAQPRAAAAVSALPRLQAGKPDRVAALNLAWRLAGEGRLQRIG